MAEEYVPGVMLAGRIIMIISAVVPEMALPDIFIRSVDFATVETKILELKLEVAAPETLHEIWLFPGVNDAAPELSASSFLHPENRIAVIKNKVSVKS
jgi:hypothetical protein